MKIIKSIAAITVCLCATTLLHAQEIKAELAKLSEVKPPPQAVRSNSPSPQPELKPQVAGEKPVAAETPKSLLSEEEVKPQKKAKSVMKVVDAHKTENQKQGPTTPNTIDQNPKMIPATKSTAVKQQQNQ
jgi:hypothetical protein